MIGLGGYFLYRDFAEGTISNETLGFAFSVFFGFVLTIFKFKELIGIDKP